MALSLASTAAAQLQKCVPLSNQQLIIYRAGSLTAAFKPLVAAFTCQTGIQVKDVAMGSVDAARRITAGGQPCDIYASADYSDIHLLMKPAGYADFNILFARGRMVLTYSQAGVTAKKLPPIAEPNGVPFEPPNSVPKAAANWYQILTMPGVVIGAGHPFLDPGAYRADLIFQLAQEFYKAPNLYNDMLEHLTIPGPGRSAMALGKGFDFQFSYEHGAQATAKTNPDFRYVDLPDEVDMSDPGKDSYYRQHAVVVLPGLGTPRSARSIPIPANSVAWGVTVLTNAPNRKHAIKFLQVLLGPTGTKMLNDNGPSPISPAIVSPADFLKLPESLRPLIKTSEK